MAMNLRKRGMVAQALVTGSLAYDHIADYAQEFKPRLAIRRKIRHTAVFPVDSLKFSMGGCAGNIAYAIAALGGDPLLVAALGRDGQHYLEHLRRLGIWCGRIRRFRETLTAQAYIANDAGENQIIFFFPGAMDLAHRLTLAPVAAKTSLAIVSPNGREAIMTYCNELTSLHVPFILDLGQGLGLFTAPELKRMLRQATYAIFNRMELEAFMSVTGLGRKKIVSQLSALIVTDSTNGSVIHAGKDIHRIEADVMGETVDPTGCGDAYRGGLMHAMLNDRSWSEAGRLASRVAGIKALSSGGQNFKISRRDLVGVEWDQPA